jgi:stage III sporulation protein AA
LEDLVDLFADRSVYAREAELSAAYLSLPGGHRVGLAGRAVLQGSRLVTTRDWTGMNIRLARPLPGMGSGLLAQVAPVGAPPPSVLVVGPPRAGKTSLLRSVVQPLSARGWRLVIVDERGELAPEGFRALHADVLEGWPKAPGLMAAVRVLGPDVVMVDEIGDAADGEVLRRARRSGVAVWASSHGGPGDVERHPMTRGLLAARVFDWVAELDAGPPRGVRRVRPV